MSGGGSGHELPGRVLIANRGEIAIRIARTCRAMGVETLAVATELDAASPHPWACDAVATVGSYVDADEILTAAREGGCDAVHPGYGFLSENAAFAEAVVGAGLTWIGPPPDAIRAMGSKTEARRLMEEAGVPVVPGSAAGDAAELARAAEEIGYPVLVKASGGGGGKGMTVVREPEALARAVESASDEARRSFGDSAVYLEKLIERPRHVEVQVFADDHDHCVSLFERECSIQRRHQKVIEEAPSPAVDEALRRRMGEAAVAAARAVGYRGAGTVELLLGDDDDFHFLEMNTRLQVEHPVTECVTGLDLVRLQLEVAAGAPLPPEALSPTLRGWAIEARIYAEDPAVGHLPQAGPLLVVREPSGPGIRIDSGIASGSEVTVHFDPMLAKLIAWGATRKEAAERLADALSRTVVLGVTTNIDLLQDVVRHPSFLAGDLSTAFLDDHFADWPGGTGERDVPAMALAATALPSRGAGGHGAGGSGGGGGRSSARDPWSELADFRIGGAA